MKPRENELERFGDGFSGVWKISFWKISSSESTYLREQTANGRNSLPRTGLIKCQIESELDG
jgi:hypothetical protein